MSYMSDTWDRWNQIVFQKRSWNDNLELKMAWGDNLEITWIGQIRVASMVLCDLGGGIDENIIWSNEGILVCGTSKNRTSAVFSWVRPAVLERSMLQDSGQGSLCFRITLTRQSVLQDSLTGRRNTGNQPSYTLKFWNYVVLGYPNIHHSTI